MLVAIDVIGLRYPLDRMEDSRRFSVTLATRRLDTVSVRRIELALKDAKQELSWRCRGWLVVLVNRWVAVGVPSVRDGLVVAYRSCSSHFRQPVIQLLHVDTIVEQPPCARQRGAAASYSVDANTNCDNSVCATTILPSAGIKN